MAMNKDILGQALYDMRNNFFNNKSIDELLMMYGSIENARLEACKKEAEVIINHITANARVPGTGLVAGSNPVTGQANIQ